MTTDLPKIDQYRSELRETIMAGVHGHKAAFADGIDPSHAFEAAAELLFHASVSNAMGDPATAIRHIAGIASEALIMLALGVEAELPDLTPEERTAASKAGAKRQAESLTRDFEWASNIVNRMLALHETSYVRNAGPEQSWDLLRAYADEQIRQLSSEGLDAETISERMAGLVARALLIGLPKAGTR